MEKSVAFIQHFVAQTGDSEGSPVSVMEAQAAALPVISTYHAGIPEVVIHGETGFLVKEKDISCMAEYMVRILAEPGLAKKLGQRGGREIQSGLASQHTWPFYNNRSNRLWENKMAPFCRWAISAISKY